MKKSFLAMLNLLPFFSMKLVARAPDSLNLKNHGNRWQIDMKNPNSDRRNKSHDQCRYDQQKRHRDGQIAAAVCAENVILVADFGGIDWIHEIRPISFA